jgi:hypothetical protein
MTREVIFEVLVSLIIGVLTAITIFLLLDADLILPLYVVIPIHVVAVSALLLVFIYLVGKYMEGRKK